MFSVLSIKEASSAYLREGKAEKMLPWFQSFPWYDKSNMQVKYVDFGNSATQSPGEEGYSHIVWVGACRWVRESPTLY